ncbi:2-dehydropantoate 2-reductase [Staphylococcus schleiferi]|uniref:oxidoreductase n=1 Tax=Staphylococcus coagulans TaxID=74706 RepID=UPI0006BCE4D5|nr:oxidoreductase [Staphylococcus coagulans]PNZ10584.1 2-dehydropantoate 2-reductase [Staphylococcus coagulans]BAS44989.1 2-dehydropantoate 2-reductase [Staphylococcus schleiferi]
MTKIAIIGPGAVGTAIASALDTQDVTLFGRQNKTVTYVDEAVSETKQVNVHALKEATDVYDVVFIAVKTHQIDTILDDLKNITHPESRVILAQNGSGLLPKLEAYHAYQAVVYISGAKQDNVVRHFKDYKIHLRRDAFTEQLAEKIQDSQLSLILEDDIDKAIWFKLIFNLGMNTLTALGRDTARLLKDPRMEQLCRNLLNEGLQVANAAGVIYEESFIDDVMAAYQIFNDDTATSMYYDTMSEQPIEVETIQGFIYREGQKYGLHIPYIETTYTLLAHQNETRLR